MKKQWIKVFVAFLIMVLLVLGVVGFSGGKFFGIQIGGSDEKNANNEENDFSQLTNKYPIPDPIRTPKEIKVAGEEVTTEDVVNAFEYFTYLLTIGTFGDNDVVSSQFVSISPKFFPVKDENKNTIKLYAPFYCQESSKEYCVTLTARQSAGDMMVEREILGYLPEEFGAVLDLLGVEKTEITEEYLQTVNNGMYFQINIGNYSYAPVIINEEFLNNVQDKDSLEAALNLLCDLCENVKAFNGRPEGGRPELEGFIPE